MMVGYKSNALKYKKKVKTAYEEVLAKVQTKDKKLGLR